MARCTANAREGPVLLSGLFLHGPVFALQWQRLLQNLCAFLHRQLCTLWHVDLHLHDWEWKWLKIDMYTFLYHHHSIFFVTTASQSILFLVTVFSPKLSHCLDDVLQTAQKQLRDFLWHYQNKIVARLHFRRVGINSGPGDPRTHGDPLSQYSIACVTASFHT